MKQAESFAAIALASIVREFPNKPGEVQAGPEDAKTPKEMHPAFFGSFDWHSSVHGHWMLARLLKLNLLGPEVANRARKVLSKHLTEENIRGELTYFEAKHNKGFERMYGWAWYLRLCLELDGWDDKDAQRWRAACLPLENYLLQATHAYLPKLTWPIRVGTHTNTAFALTHIWDYAAGVGDVGLADLVRARSLDWFKTDREWPWGFEPSGHDFLSAGLEEVDLMRRVMEPQDFENWLNAFMLPSFAPAEVSDVTDGQIVHLAGLNLARAWCMEGLASHLGPDDSRTNSLWESAKAHREIGLGYVTSGHYEGEHWLASFAVYLATGCGR
ncbi:MAG TPA: DUF2891 domain-containing protein [Planctomycetes bacterium]|nr:DUF2891 domain-containing protein [Planctomycetota bacterium]